MSEGIIGPVTESLSLSPDEIEEIHAVVSAVETERQARQASRRRSRQEVGYAPAEQSSEVVIYKDGPRTFAEAIRAASPERVRQLAQAAFLEPLRRQKIITAHRKARLNG